MLSVGRTLTDRWPYVTAAGLVLGLDRWSKSVVQAALEPGVERVVVAGFFDLVHFQNTGVAFGLFSGGQSMGRVVVLSGLAVAASVVVVVYSMRSPAADRLLQYALALILGGALGNLYDRVRLGHVVDFLYFHAGAYYWPAFNAADASISIGAALLLAVVVRDEIRARS